MGWGSQAAALTLPPAVYEGQEQCPPRKGVILSPLPILEDPSRGGLEAFNTTVVLIAIAGRGVGKGERVRL